MNRKWLFGLISVVVIITAISAIVYANREKNEAHEVKVEIVKNQDITSSISANGVIEEVTRKDIYAEQTLKVRKVYVKKGDKVKVGEKIIEYDMDQIESQYRDLLETKASQKKAIAKLEAEKEDNYLAASNTMNHEGNSGIPMQGDMESLLSQYGITEVPQGAQSPDSLYGIREVNLETQKQSLESMENKIADMKKLIKKIKDSTFSPISGVVSEVNATDGGYASVQLPTIRIIDDENLQVKANVREFDIKKVSLGQDVIVLGDAIDENDRIRGKVAKISPIAKRNRTATGEETLIEVVIALNDYYPGLIPGLSATCKIVTGFKENVPVINLMALKEDKSGSRSVFVLEKNEQLANRNVKLGISSEMKVEVVEGLKAGDLVVQNWKPNFKTGDKAKIIGESEG